MPLAMTYRARLSVVFAGAALLAAACAVKDEGATDFRSISPSGTVRKNFFPSEAERPILPGEPILVTLKQAFIAHFTEVLPNPFTERGGPTGELAIVANVFEDDGSKSLDFSPSAIDTARVVFFSDDVHKGQFLNFHDLPVYGPLSYDGGAMFIDMYIVELDVPGEQLRQLMSNLAAIGGVFYPPASPVVGPLAELAGTLITDDQDDRAYRHALYMRPEGGAAGIRYSVLDAGYVVFIRENDREADTDWSALALNEHLARLVYRNPPGVGDVDCVTGTELPSDCFYRQNTYLVLEVNTAASALANDRQQILFKALREDFSSKSAPILRGPVSEEALRQLAQRVRQAEMADRASSALSDLERSTSKERRTAAAERFAAVWFATGSTKEELEKAQANFTERDRERLMKRLGIVLAECKVQPSDLDQIMTKARAHDPAIRTRLVQSVSCEPTPAPS